MMRWVWIALLVLLAATVFRVFGPRTPAPHCDPHALTVDCVQF